MPRSFPDLDSLKWNAQMRNFRQPNEGESENDYRAALAQHVQDLGDMVEAMEIRSGKGWDQWDSHTTQAMLEEASPGIADILREAREQKVATLMTAMEAAGPEQTLAILAELLGHAKKPVEDDGLMMVDASTGKWHRANVQDYRFRYLLLFDTAAIEQKAYVECFPEEIFNRISFPVSNSMFTGRAIVFSRQMTVDANNCPTSVLLNAANKFLDAPRRQFARAVVVTIGTYNFVLKNASGMPDTIVLDLFEEYAERKATSSTELKNLYTESFNSLDEWYPQLKNEELDRLFDSINPPKLKTLCAVTDSETGATRWVPRIRNLIQYVIVYGENFHFKTDHEIRELIEEHSFLMFGEDNERVFGPVLRYDRSFTREKIEAWGETSHHLGLLRHWCNRRLFDPATFVMAEVNGERFVIKNHAELKPSHIRKAADYALTREACPFPPLP